MEEKYANYLEILEDARKYNSHLFAERKLRLPFLDSQTGIAQNDCSIWRSSDERLSPIQDRISTTHSKSTVDTSSTSNINQKSSILIKYTAQRWIKKKRNYLSLEPSLPTTSNSSIPRNSEATNDLSEVTYHNLDVDQDQDAPHQARPRLIDNSNNNNSNFFNSEHSLRADSRGSQSGQSIGSSDSRDGNSNSNSTSNFCGTSGQSTESSQSNNNTNHHDLPDQVDLKIQSIGSSSQCNGFIVNNNQSKQDVSSNQLEEQTKRAIRLHNKISKKKKNVGQSLIKASNNNQVQINSKRSDSDKSVDRESQFEVLMSIDSTASDEPKPNSSVMKLKCSNGQRTDLNNNPETLLQNSSMGEAYLTKHALIDANASRPYICSICDQSYKTRPGLTYHFQHTHKIILPRHLPAKASFDVKGDDSIQPSQITQVNGNNNNNKTNLKEKKEQSITVSKNKKLKMVEKPDDEPIKSQSIMVNGSAIDEDSHSDGASTIIDDPSSSTLQVLEVSIKDTSVVVTGVSENGNLSEVKTNSHLIQTNIHQEPSTNKEKTSNKLKHNMFCDFCLGTAEKNRRTRLPEELISCSRCGSSGHPSCLRFSENILMSVRKYDWQCIDCKTCSNCNNADNEDKLLFCDDCDRSYHTYCLNPNLKELPEGSWSCEACMLEYHSIDS